jgi:hypothetical protein
MIVCSLVRASCVNSRAAALRSAMIRFACAGSIGSPLMARSLRPAAALLPGLKLVDLRPPFPAIAVDRRSIAVRLPVTRHFAVARRSAFSTRSPKASLTAFTSRRRAAGRNPSSTRRLTAPSLMSRNTTTIYVPSALAETPLAGRVRAWEGIHREGLCHRFLFAVHWPILLCFGISMPSAMRVSASRSAIHSG